MVAGRIGRILGSGCAEGFRRERAVGSWVVLGSDRVRGAAAVFVGNGPGWSRGSGRGGLADCPR